MSSSLIKTLKTKLANFERAGLMAGPTPLEPLINLSKYLGGPRLWIKREDLSGRGFGGNKLRKLDFVLADAISSGADTLISGGVVQSNSQRQVAAASALLRMECHLAVYKGRVDISSDDYMYSGNMLLDKLYGAHLHEVPWTGDRNKALFQLEQALQAQGKNTFVVPYGVSNGLGAVGYSSVCVELAQQCLEKAIMPAAIVHSSGSGATQAGVAVGASIALPSTEVLGIDIDAEPERVKADVTRFALEAANLLDVSFDPAKLIVLAGHSGPAYGVPHESTLNALSLAAKLEALILDPVYSAKALAALISLIKSDRWNKDSDVVFLHTGGEPSLFAYRHYLELE